MSSNKKNVIIGIFSIWSIRNVFLTEIFNELKKHYNIYIATSAEYVDIVKEYSNNEIIVINKIKQGKISNFIHKILIKSFTIKNSYQTVSAIRNKSSVNKKKNIKTLIVIRSIFIIANLTIFTNLMFFLEKYWLKQMRKKVSQKTMRKLIKIDPKLIFLTSIVLPKEQSLYFLGQELKIKTILHILSFDNITSRGFLPLRNIHKYLVWNNIMKEELMNIYKVQERKIEIVGTPQFSFHYRTPKIIRKETIYRKYNIPKEYKYVVYASNHYYHTPNEQEVVENIITNIIQKKENIFLILRLHPLDNYDRWNELMDKYKQYIKISIPWKKEKGKVISINKNDIYDFTGLLYYASVVFNIASTITIDASILDTPAICIGFHPIREKEGEYYFNVHFSNHYKKIIKMRAVPLVTNQRELHDEFFNVISDKDIYKKNRKELSHSFIGNTLGFSEKLILKNLIEYEN